MLGRMRYRNENLFSNHFLDTRLQEMPEWRALEPRTGLLENLRHIFERARAGLPAANESQTENDLIRPLLEALSLPFDVQTELPAWAGRRVPDYAIFPSDKARAEATPLRGSPEFWMRACAVADAKGWNTRLDQPGGGGAGRTPAQQLTEYMRDANQSWGVLTNGRTWRLYARDPSRRATNFFEVDLEHALYGSDEEYRLFLLLFGPSGLVPAPVDGRTFNDRLLQGSLTYAQAIGERLRDRAFRTVEVLARGFAVHERWRTPTRERLDSLYSNSLVLLYRLLFVFSAEARGLLPIDHPTYSAYSLLRLRAEIRERHLGRSLATSSCDFYSRLVNLFNLIDRGDASIGVPPYNGGLFDPELHPFLRDSCCRDPHLAEGIYQLAYDVSPGGDEPIDYRDIAPRHLGTIYEGLLEFRLTLAEQPLGVATRNGVEVYLPETTRRPAVVQIGDLYLHNDRGERRATGSYYTPDYIVDYIVSNALEPALIRRAEEVAARVQRFDDEIGALTEPERSDIESVKTRYVSAIGDLLMDMRVLDPAMGSGHFLVGAMHYIADSVYTNPHFQVADDDPHGVLLRRRIAEKCLYGVDSNELAVELARLTIWLETVAPDRPLSFLDHHLKVGNSLLGAWLSEVGQLTATPPGYVSLAEHEFEKDLPTVLGELVAITKRDAVTHEDVEEKLAHAARATGLLDPYKQVANFWLSVARFGQEGDQTLLDAALLGIRDEEQRARIAGEPRWKVAMEFARESQFFHWEIEFPDVFFDASGDRLENVGFDAVIGNPPYEVLETRRSDFQDPDGNWTPEGQPRFEARQAQLARERAFYRRGSFSSATSGGKLDYYRLFIERALNLAPQGSAVGMIVPRSLLADLAATGIRRRLWDETVTDPVEVFPKDPPSCWVFPEAELAVVVFVAHKEVATGILRVRGQACREINGSLPFANVSKDDAGVLDKDTLPIPLLTSEEVPLIRRVYEAEKTGRFKDVAPCRIGEINSEYGKPYMQDVDTGTLLIRGRHVARLAVDERTLDTAKRWIDEEAYLKSLENPDERPALRQRIVKQAVNDMNDPRRIIAAMCSPGRYLLDSCDYLDPVEPYEPAYALALLLSDVCEWRFRLTSSNNNVNGYEIDELPFPLVDDWEHAARSRAAAELVGEVKRGLSDSPREAYLAVGRFLERGSSRSSIHDAISTLTGEAARLRGEALEALDNFRLYLRSLEGGARLQVGFVGGDWARLGEDDFFAQLRTQGVDLPATAIMTIRKERKGTLDALRPRIEEGDLLETAINEACYALFGLSEEDANTIRSHLPARPGFLSMIA